MLLVIMKKLGNRIFSFLVCIIVLLVLCSNSIVNGLNVVSDLGDVMMLSPRIVSSQGGGQGTHENF